MTDEVKDPEGLLKAYNKAKEDLVALRAELVKLEKDKEALEAEKAEFDKNISEAVSKWKSEAINSKAVSELTAQGIKNPERILKYVKFDDVDFDKDGKLSGLDTSLKAVKEDFPELFDVKRRASRQSADIHTDTPVDKPKTGTEAQVERMFSKSNTRFALRKGISYTVKSRTTYLLGRLDDVVRAPLSDD